MEGDDWWQLSEHEEAVFEIDLDRFPLMVTAFGAWQVMVGMTEGTFWDMQHPDVIEAARAERPDIVNNPDERKGWREFAKTFAGLNGKEAYKMYSKHDAWELRLGVLMFSDA